MAVDRLRVKGSAPRRTWGGICHPPLGQWICTAADVRNRSGCDGGRHVFATKVLYSTRRSLYVLSQGIGCATDRPNRRLSMGAASVIYRWPALQHRDWTGPDK